MAKSHTTHTPPPVIENLGDNTYYYNFNIHETKIDGVLNYHYMQVRCNYPISKEEMQQEIDRKQINHYVPDF